MGQSLFISGRIRCEQSVQRELQNKYDQCLRTSAPHNGSSLPGDIPCRSQQVALYAWDTMIQRRSSSWGWQIAHSFALDALDPLNDYRDHDRVIAQETARNIVKVMNVFDKCTRL